jgi:hypothetical protein
MPALMTVWSGTGSLHDTIRVFGPDHALDPTISAVFLNNNDGDPWNQVLANMPGTSDVVTKYRRLRAVKELFEASGLMWKDAHPPRIRFTDFGGALKRFLPHANESNIRLFARYASLALARCQLRNPTTVGRKYDPVMVVHPHRYIWEALSKLDWRIDSDELDRAIFAVQNADMLPEAIDKIRTYRMTRHVADLGSETVNVNPDQKNNRIISVVCLASFGWTLINRKTQGGGEYYTVADGCEPLLEAALSVPPKHRDFGNSLTEYLNWIVDGACLPRDCRP